MQRWEFQLWLSGTPDDIGEWSGRLHEAGCDDSFCFESAGKPHVLFQRDGESLQAAIRSAVEQVQSCGFTIDRVRLQAEAVLSYTIINGDGAPQRKAGQGKASRMGIAHQHTANNW